MAEATSVADVLGKTREMLRTAERGLSDLLGQQPDDRPIGLYNVAVFGRSVTLVLQNMRTVAREQFDAWYAPFVAEMANDPLLTYFKELRNDILKEGPPSLSSSLYIEQLNSTDIARLTKNPPPGAKGVLHR